MNVLIWGAGSVGGAVGIRLVRAGHTVTAVTATARRHTELQSMGLLTARAEDPPDLGTFDATLIATPGSENQAAAARTLGGRLRGRVVFTSTTAVHQGCTGYVQASGPFGDSERARAARSAEKNAADLGAVIVRLGGLYRAGRGPAAAFARTGTAPPGEGGRTLALIHEEDAATALIAALLTSRPEPAYLAVTPPCPTRAVFYAALAERLGVDPPPMFPGGEPTTFAVEPLRRDLVPNPAYPDWRAALVS
jgi:nucleoside-diphosphate-sugar epimerase